MVLLPTPLATADSDPDHFVLALPMSTDGTVSAATPAKRKAPSARKSRAKPPLTAADVTSPPPAVIPDADPAVGNDIPSVDSENLPVSALKPSSRSTPQRKSRVRKTDKDREKILSILNPAKPSEVDLGSIVLAAATSAADDKREMIGRGILKVAEGLAIIASSILAGPILSPDSELKPTADVAAPAQPIGSLTPAAPPTEVVKPHADSAAIDPEPLPENVAPEPEAVAPEAEAVAPEPPVQSLQLADLGLAVIAAQVVSEEAEEAALELNPVAVSPPAAVQEKKKRRTKKETGAEPGAQASAKKRGKKGKDSSVAPDEVPAPAAAVSPTKEPAVVAGEEAVVLTQPIAAVSEVANSAEKVQKARKRKKDK